MVCPNCGFNCDDGSKICSRCGNKFKKKVKVKKVKERVFIKTDLPLLKGDILRKKL